MAIKSSTAKKRDTKVGTTRPVQSKEGILSTNRSDPEDIISTDQFNARASVCLQSGDSRDGDKNCYHEV